ncbi:ASKHA domain-containing protein [Desulfovibrio sp.]|uniref:ASKHA domain-containing protein n=1 Tax=Desulfovibrio sp. TaxID=885 RepID=UPI0023D782DC|nr:ASKHA domain-containing protein [Desulfovibrio sp.]MDE7242221.1 ASKHA domain-containing protein [Desulfovibrio sp.]
MRDVILRLRAPGTDAPVIEVPARSGEDLARAIWLSGALAPRPLCLGLGRCGRCRVRYVADAPPPLPEDAAILAPHDVAAGWRLACRRAVPEREGAGSRPGGALELEVPEEAFAPAPDAGMPTAGAPEPLGADECVVLGVDLGTTSLQWRACGVDAAADGPGRVLAEGSLLNPQAGAGADIMSRLAYARAPGGLATLGRLARGAVRAIADRLARDGLAPLRICVAANTAMTDIFLGRDVTGLCAAPYRRSHAGGRTVDLPNLPPVLIPPLPAPFVGGDLSAGLAALLAQDTPRPFVLADLGTNGELALLTEDERLILASVPLGPALEGIGPERGGMAGPGVATEFRLGPRGLQPVLFGEAGHPNIGGEAAPDADAAAISATGYLSLLALLFRLGVLDVAGHFARPASLALPLARTLAGKVESGPGGARLPLPLGLWLSAADVELLLKVKAAFAVALAAVCAAASLSPSALRRLALAGALGEHARTADLKDLGFAPGIAESKIVAVGNTSLAGAVLLAARPERLEALAALCGRAEVLELTAAPGFQRDYLAQMRLGD